MKDQHKSRLSDAFCRFMRGLVHLTLGIALISLFGAAPLKAQETKKPPRIGMLSPGDVKYWNDGFFSALREQGFVDGVTAHIDVRSTFERFDLGPKYAEELVALNPDVIFVVPGAFARDVTRALEKTGKKIPIVVATYDPVAEGFADSVTHPGKNITGVGVAYDTGIVGKHLQLVKDMVPNASRVIHLYDRTWAEKQEWSRLIKDGLEEAGRKMGVSVVSIEVNSSDQFEKAFLQASRTRADAIIVPPVPLFNAPANRARIIQFAARQRIPAIYFDELFAHDGGLISYWTSVRDLLTRGGLYVAKILKGAKPSDLPIEYPTRIRLVVNLRTAKALGLTIPQSVLVQADEVIR